MTQGQIIIAILTIANTWLLLFAKSWLDKRAAAKAKPDPNQPIITTPKGNVGPRLSRLVLVPRTWFSTAYFTSSWLSLYLAVTIAVALVKGDVLPDAVRLLIGSIAVFFSANMMLWRSTNIYQ